LDQRVKTAQAQRKRPDFHLAFFIKQCEIFLRFLLSFNRERFLPRLFRFQSCGFCFRGLTLGFAFFLTLLARRIALGPLFHQLGLL
jgi:hypothetical protein